MKIRGKRIRLRGWESEDIERYLRWLREPMEWQRWDAPWEGPPTEEKLIQIKQRKLAELSNPPVPRTSLLIETSEGLPIGWVNRYWVDRERGLLKVGIVIVEPSYWHRGFGTEALGLWINYLFEEMEIHRIGMSTWSGNVRMIRCAQKLGFQIEGEIRETTLLEGKFYNTIEMGILRREWEGKVKA